MKIQVVRTVNDLVAMDFQNCYTRYSELDADGKFPPKLEQALHIILYGKPVIAAFMGISEKTLKRWFEKYDDLPIRRGGRRCFASADNLLWWIQQCESACNIDPL